MTALRQKQPRVEDPAHLVAVRKMPCMACGKTGPNDAAHIRSGSPFYQKRNTGFGEKPDDKWTLPLCRDHHREQHAMNELAFWRQYRINPFLEAKRLYGDRAPPTPKPSDRPAKRKKAKASKPIPARVDPWPEGRKIPARQFERPRHV